MTADRPGTGAGDGRGPEPDSGRDHGRGSAAWPVGERTGRRHREAGGGLVRVVADTAAQGVDVVVDDHLQLLGRGAQFDQAGQAGAGLGEDGQVVAALVDLDFVDAAQRRGGGAEDAGDGDGFDLLALLRALGLDPAWQGTLQANVDIWAARAGHNKREADGDGGAAGLPALDEDGDRVMLLDDDDLATAMDHVHRHPDPHLLLVIE